MNTRTVASAAFALHITVKEVISFLAERGHVCFSAASQVSEEEFRALQEQFSGRPQTASQKNDPEQRTIQALQSHRYLMLTSSVLRKKGMACFLQNLMRMYQLALTEIQVVVLEAAYQKLRTLHGQQYTEVADLLYQLREQKHLTMSPGISLLEEDESLYRLAESIHEHSSVLLVTPDAHIRVLYEYYKSRYSYAGQKLNTMHVMDVAPSGLLTNQSYEAKCYVFDCARGKAPAAVADTVLPLSGELPTTGSVVTAGGQMLTVGRLLSDSGAEAHIYDVEGTDLCMKVFDPRSRTQCKLAKVQSLVVHRAQMANRNPGQFDHLAWPVEMVCNSSGEPVGYIMPRFDGMVPLADFTARSFSSHINGVTKQDTACMCKNLAELMAFCHQNELVLCDLNFNNILFDPQTKEAYLVDLDSAQFAERGRNAREGYFPSATGRRELLSPEHILQGDFDFCRSKADDTWVLSLVVFYLMTGCGHPYLYRGEDKVDATANGRYYYQCGEIHCDPDKIPGGYAGDWYRAVSNQPGFMKRHFYDCFSANGRYFREEDRRDALWWLNEMLRYQHYLEVSPDDQALDIRPERNKSGYGKSGRSGGSFLNGQSFRSWDNLRNDRL